MPIECNKLYVVYYEGRWYAGQILEIINEGASGETFKINFLQKERKQNKMFTCPKMKQDIVTVEHQYIFYGPIKFVNEVEPFRLDEETYAKICNTYDKMKAALKTGKS